MKRALVPISLAASLACAAILGAAQPPIEVLDLQAWIEPEREAYPADQALRYSIQVRWKMMPGVDVNVLEIPELQNLKCAGYSARQAASSASGEAAARFQFTLVPQGTGPARIGPTYLETDPSLAEARQRIRVEGRVIQIGDAPVRRGLRPVASAGVAFGLALAGSLLVWMRRRKVKPVVSASPDSPFGRLRERGAELDRLMVEDGAALYWERLRDRLIEALRLARVVEKAPTAGEFAAWLDRQDAARRVDFAPALALLEQVERVRFAGWMPTPEENRAARRELELTIDRLERLAAEPHDTESAR